MPSSTVDSSAVTTLFPNGEGSEKGWRLGCQWKSDIYMLRLFLWISLQRRLERCWWYKHCSRHLANKINELHGSTYQPPSIKVPHISHFLVTETWSRTTRGRGSMSIVTSVSTFVIPPTKNWIPRLRHLLWLNVFKDIFTGTHWMTSTKRYARL